MSDDILISKYYLVDMAEGEVFPEARDRKSDWGELPDDNFQVVKGDKLADMFDEFDMFWADAERELPAGSEAAPDRPRVNIDPYLITHRRRPALEFDLTSYEDRHADTMLVEPERARALVGYFDAIADFAAGNEPPADSQTWLRKWGQEYVLVIPGGELGEIHLSTDRAQCVVQHEDIIRQFADDYAPQAEPEPAPTGLKAMIERIARLPDAEYALFTSEVQQRRAELRGE